MSQLATVQYPVLIKAIGSFVTKHPTFRDYSNWVGRAYHKNVRDRVEYLHEYLTVLTRPGNGGIIIGAPALIDTEAGCARQSVVLLIDEQDVKWADIGDTTLRLNCGVAAGVSGDPIDQVRASDKVTVSLAFSLSQFFDVNGPKMVGIASFNYEEGMHPNLVGGNLVGTAGSLMHSIAELENSNSLAANNHELHESMLAKEQVVCQLIANDLHSIVKMAQA